MTVAYLSKMLNPELRVIIQSNGERLHGLKAKDAEASEFGRYEVENFNMSTVYPACVIEIHF